MATNLPGIFSGKPYAGLLSFNTASFFQLDPTGTTPLLPLPDVLPGGFTLKRITLDMIDVENYSETFAVTTNVLQDFSDTTPNVHKNLIQMNITGTVSAAAQPSIIGIGTIPTLPGLRLDKLRIANLQRLADRRKPIMVVTPRVSLATCFITGISRPWTPATGQATVVTISIIEARIASPANIAVLPDTETLEAGNLTATGGGEQAVSAVATPPVGPAPVSQLPPDIGSLALSPATI